MSIFKLLFVDSIVFIDGVVIVGNMLEIKYLGKDELIIVDWSGFVDNESGLSYFEWVVCKVVFRDDCNILFVDVGFKVIVENFVFDIKFGIFYVLIVWVYNNVGLFREIELNQFILDEILLIVGIVYDGFSDRNDYEL